MLPLPPLCPRLCCKMPSMSKAQLPLTGPARGPPDLVLFPGLCWSSPRHAPRTQAQEGRGPIAQHLACTPRCSQSICRANEWRSPSGVPGSRCRASQTQLGLQARRCHSGVTFQLPEAVRSHLCIHLLELIPPVTAIFAFPPISSLKRFVPSSTCHSASHFQVFP